MLDLCRCSQGSHSLGTARENEFIHDSDPNALPLSGPSTRAERANYYTSGRIEVRRSRE